MKSDKSGERLLIIMKDILSEAQFSRIFLRLKCRRRQNNTFLYLTYALVFDYSTIYRPIWTKPCTQNFWTKNLLNYWTNEDWVQNLRIHKEIFTYICKEIRKFVEKQKRILGKHLLWKWELQLHYIFTIVHASTGQLLIYLELADQQFAIFYMQLMKPLKLVPKIMFVKWIRSANNYYKVWGNFQLYHNRLREYRFCVNIGRGVNIGCDRCFYIMLLITSCIAFNN